MINIVYAMGQPAGGAQQTPQNALLSFLPLILIFIVFYFLMIKPQAKKQKEHQEMINSLKKGDKIITTGGILGTVVGFKEKNIVTLAISEKVEIDVLRSAITSIQEKSNS